MHDTNYADRIGWKEIVVGATHAQPLRRAARVPEEPAAEPARRDARCARPSRRRSDPCRGCSRGRSLEAPDRVADSGFTRLIGERHLSVLVILVSLAAALFWGAAHALSPGPRQDDRDRVPRRHARHAAGRGAPRPDRHGHAHDRRLRARARDARALAVDRPRHALPVARTLVAGMLRRRHRRSPCCAHGSRLAARSAPTATATSTTTATITTTHRSRVAASAACSRSASRAALLPCPSALVVLLAAISLHRVAFGLVLIVAFSLGLALTITGIGLVAVLAQARRSRRRSFDGLLVRALPAVSAARHRRRRSRA